LTPEALFRPPSPRERRARPRAESAINGLILDLAVEEEIPEARAAARLPSPSPADTPAADGAASASTTGPAPLPAEEDDARARASVLVLTDRALLRVRLEGERLAIEVVEDLLHAPAAAVPTRLPSGSVVTSTGTSGPRICHGSNLWPSGT